MSCSDVRDLWPGAGLSDFDVTFEYEEQSDVRVALWNSTTKEYDDKTEYTPGQVDDTYWKWMNATEIRFVDQDDTTVTINTPAADTDLGYTPDGVKIYRSTDIDPLPATFYPGSSIRAQDLNDNFDVLKMAIEEAKCGSEEVLDTVDKQYWNKTNDTIRSGDEWLADDNHVVTALAGDDRWLNSTGGDIVGRDMITATEVSGKINLDVDLDPNGGLESTNPGDPAGQLRVKKGNGIVVGSAGVTVGQGTGITVNTNDVAVTSQTVWGQTHDHSATVDGDMTNVGDITFEAGGGTLNGVANENIQIDSSGTGILDVNRNTDISGTLNVDGNTTFGSSGSNTHEFDGDVTILRQGDLKFNGAAASDGGSAEFVAPNQFFDSGGSTPTDFSYTLPASAPSGDRVLQSDSSGVMSWVVGGGGSGTGAIQDLDNTTTTGNVTITISDGGDNTTIAAANTTRAGVMTSGMFDKLSGLPGSGTGVLNLEDLNDVTITSIADGQVIRWDGTNSRWENELLFSGGAVLNFRGVVDMRSNNPTIAYGSIAAGDFWVHDDPSESDPAEVVGTAQQDSTVPSGWTRVNNPGGGSETVNNTELPVARGTMVVAGQSFTISGTDIINFVQLGTINAGTVTGVTASNGLTDTVTGTTTNISMDTTGVTAGDYGSASQVPVLSINDRGQITSASTANIPANTNTEYVISVEQTGGNDTDPNLRLTGTDSSTDNVTFEGGTNVTVTRVDDNRISIAADGGGSGTITEVSTSDGLTGGGSSGSVNVGIADNGVTTTKINNNAVTYAKMQDMAANTILGNNTGSAADPKALTVDQAQSLLNITPGATTNTGTVTSVTAGAGMTQTGTSTVNPTLNVVGASSGGITVNSDSIQLTSIAANTVLANSSGGANTPSSNKVTPSMLNGVGGNGTSGQVLASQGNGSMVWANNSSYSDADVDTHLNTSTATSGQVLSWTGTDYDWIDKPNQSGGDIACRLRYNMVDDNILASKGIDSITDDAVGKITINFTTAFSDVNYSVVAMGIPEYSCGSYRTDDISTTSYPLDHSRYSTGWGNASNLYVVVVS